MLTVTTGSQLIDLIELAYTVGQPIMLHGRHGLGKSEILDQAATKLGVGIEVRDLSLMEPPDLCGIPQVGGDGRTHYAPPAFLPTGGQGLLIIEELNRAPRYMQGPCLQLLTARRLNDYTLPKGWLPCGAVNDAADGYLVDELDAALLSRFMNVKVEPDVEQWVAWARDNDIHEKVIEFVVSSPRIFEDPLANPRAWTYTSRLLSAWEAGERRHSLLAGALAGVVGDKWALAFMRVYGDERLPLRPEEIIEDYPAYRAAVRMWIENGQLDVVAASIELIKKHLQPQAVYNAVVRNAAHKANVKDFIQDLRGDLKRQLREWLKDRGFTALFHPRRAKKPTP